MPWRPLDVQFVAAVNQETDEAPCDGGGVDVTLNLVAVHTLTSVWR